MSTDTDQKVSVTAKTRLEKAEDRVETKMTIDFTDVTREQLIKAATKSIVIWRQSGYREDGKIPAADEFSAKEYFEPRTRTRKPVTAESLKASAVKILSPEEMAAWARELLKQAEDAKKAAAAANKPKK